MKITPNNKEEMTYCMHLCDCVTCMLCLSAAPIDGTEFRIEDLYLTENCPLKQKERKNNEIYDIS